jgi:hypothetical protein
MDKKDPSSNTGQLGNLIERYKKILKPPQSSVVKEVIGVIEEVVGIKVSAHQLEYKVASRTVFIRTPSVIKGEILQRRDLIKQKLTDRLGELNAPVNFL